MGTDRIEANKRFPEITKMLDLNIKAAQMARRYGARPTDVLDWTTEDIAMDRQLTAFEFYQGR